MNIISRLTTIGIPTVVGMGFAWLGIRIISNEKRLAEREMELELQLGAKSLKCR